MGLANVDSNNILSNNIIISNLIKDKLDVNTTGVVMADSYYNCGPAALATVLQNYCGVSVSQDTLAIFAGTDDSGTSMYGLSQAAIEEGLIAKGLELTINQLEPGNIVYLTQNGEGHFSVINSITSTTVYLADSNLGNINMTLTDFTSYYSGYALVITDNINNVQLKCSKILTFEQMKELIGSWVHWSWSVPYTFVGRVMGPSYTDGNMEFLHYIDFNSFYGSKYNIKTTLTNWGIYNVCLISAKLIVYDTSYYTNIISQETQYAFLTISQNSYTFTFTTAPLQTRSLQWGIKYTLKQVNTEGSEVILIGGGKIFLGGSMMIVGTLSAPVGLGFPLMFFGQSLFFQGFNDIVFDLWGNPGKNY